MDLTNKQINVTRMASNSTDGSTVVLVEVFEPIGEDVRRMTDQIELKVGGYFMFPQDPELLTAIAQRLMEV